MKLVKALIWPVITYGAEGWTLKEDERRLEAAEMWCYRRLQTRAYWMNFKLDANSLHAQIIKRKWLSLDMLAETISAI